MASRASLSLSLAARQALHGCGRQPRADRADQGRVRSAVSAAAQSARRRRRAAQVGAALTLGPYEREDDDEMHQHWSIIVFQQSFDFLHKSKTSLGSRTSLILLFRNLVKNQCCSIPYHSPPSICLTLTSEFGIQRAAVRFGSHGAAVAALPLDSVRRLVGRRRSRAAAVCVPRRSVQPESGILICAEMQ